MNIFVYGNFDQKKNYTKTVDSNSNTPTYQTVIGLKLSI